MLARGRAVSGLGWKLVGWEQDRQLGLDLESPAGHGLPAGRFFVIQPPGSASLTWRVTPLDAAGHKVAFSDF